MEKHRSKTHTLFTFVIVLVLSFTNILGGLDIYAATPKPKTADSFVSTELEVSQYWTFSISGTVVTATLFDSEAAQGANTLLSIVEDDNYDKWSTISAGKSTMSVNVNNLSDGLYTLRLWEARKGDTSGRVTSLADYQLQIKNGSALFYFPGGETETSFRDGFLDYNPQDYDGIPAFAEQMSNLNAITSLAASLVSGKNSDQEKTKAIHDWLATNIAYDYKSLNSGNTQNAADANSVFETHHAVCSGYARLARIMFGAVGIPCLNINGYSDNNGIQAGTDYNPSNHEWNAVYLDGGWRLLDITWDSVNKYYGEGDTKNVSGQPPVYTYYGVSPLLISSDHCSIGMYNFKDRASDLAPEDAGEYGGFSYKVFHNGTIGITACSLTGDIVIPSEINGKKVTNLAEELFYGKEGIRSVTIPETVTYFGEDTDDNDWDYVFSYCFDLERIDVKSGNPSFASVDGILFNKNKTRLLSYPCNKAGTEYHVPATVTYLACASFASAANLQDLYVDGKDTTWATYTFLNDIDLKVHYYAGGSTESFVKDQIANNLSGAENNYPTFVNDSSQPVHVHSLSATPAKAATCTQAGNSAYWTCSSCNKFFSDAEGKTEIERDSWIINPIKHTLTATPAKAATETEPGNSAYWTCSVCKKHFADAEGKEEIDRDSWVIPALGHVHSLTPTPAKDATCTQAGNTAYWTCSGCNKFFSDADGKKEIEKDSWIINPIRHSLTATPAKAATETEPGNSAYWTCSVCKNHFADAEGKKEIDRDSWVIPALGHVHSLTPTPAKDATCTQAGNTAYWTCSGCNKFFSDAEGKKEIEKDSWSINPIRHSLTATPAKATTETEPGNSAYRTCSVCKKHFADAEGNEEIEKNSWIIPELGHVHNLTAIPAKDATCTQAGNTAYWTCSGCNKFFSDAEGKKEIAKNSWIINPIRHSLIATPAKAATETEPGNSAYWTCSVCKKHFADAEGTQEIENNSWVIPVLSHVHKLTATPAKDASCTQAGNSAYWTCSVCNKFFSDADGKMEIEKDSWVIPATGHKSEIDASIPATYTRTGLTEGSHCSVCKEVLIKQEIIPKLEKLAQPMKVKTVKKTVYYSKLKKKSRKVSPIVVQKAKGKITYKITGGKKKSKKALSINGKNGKITVKKKTKKGTYTVKVTVTAAGSEMYKSGSKSVKVTVIVR